MTNPSGPDRLADLLSRAAPVPSPEQIAALENRILRAVDPGPPPRVGKPRVWLMPAASMAASLVLGLLTGYALLPAQPQTADLSSLMILTLGPAEIFAGWFNIL